MATEVWFRDPHLYVKELVEVGVDRIAWNRGVLTKKRIDPLVWAELYYGAGHRVRQLAVGPQGTAEVGPGRNLDNPIAVYPTWRCGDDQAFLEEMMENPVGQNMAACLDPSLPPDERPVFGQEHRVVVTEIPLLTTGSGRSVMAMLKRMQEDYPECILMMHGLYSFKFSFGMGFRAADVEPRSSAANKKVMLASGAELDFTRVQKKASWVTAMGMKPGDLDVPRNRCIFNIRSALWAGENYQSLKGFRTTPQSEAINTMVPDSEYTPSPGRILPLSARAVDGDKILCNTCSLNMDCKQYRVDEVCSLSDGKTSDLARFFNTRDSQTIVDGLGVLLQMQAGRLENAVSEENIIGDVNPEVTKLINSLFTQGVQLAKLVDPALRGGVKVNVGVGVINGQATANATISNKTPAELTGEVVRALEQQGIPRDKITPDLVMATIRGMGDEAAKNRAIEGTIIGQEA